MVANEIFVADLGEGATCRRARKRGCGWGNGMFVERWEWEERRRTVEDKKNHRRNKSRILEMVFGNQKLNLLLLGQIERSSYVIEKAY